MNSHNSLRIKGHKTGREIVRVTPESAGWNYVGFEALRFKDQENYIFETHQREVCLVILSGIVSIKARLNPISTHSSNAQTKEWTHSWDKIGERMSVFEDKSPYAVYVPQGHQISIEAHTNAEIALCSAPSVHHLEAPLEARLIKPSQINRSIRGQGSNTRYVCDILPQTEPAQHLLVVEVITPSGHSSSYPPHKHDTDDIPHESVLEETYYHRINPSQGFVFQRVYTDDLSLDESIAASDHDVVCVPKGYHPVVVPHGYDSYYLNVMAGPKRVWHFKNDPTHEWLMGR